MSFDPELLKAPRFGKLPAALPTRRRMTLAATVTGVVRCPVKILVYGVPGVGKSELASQAPSPIYLPTEDGTSQLNITRLPRAETWEDVLDAVDELTTAEHTFQTVVIDTVTGIEPLLFAKLCRTEGWTNIDNPNFGKGEKAAMPLWRELLSRFERLQAKRAMHVLLLGHASVKPFSDPDPLVGRYDRYNLNITSNKDADATALLCSWCDVIAFASFDVSKRNVKDRQALSSGERWLSFQRTAAFEAKTRFDHPPRIPFRRGLGWADLWAPIEPADNIKLFTDANALTAHLTDTSTKEAAQQAIKESREDGKELRRIISKLQQIIIEQGEQSGQAARDAQEVSSS